MQKTYFFNPTESPKYEQVTAPPDSSVQHLPASALVLGDQRARYCGVYDDSPSHDGAEDQRHPLQATDKRFPHSHRPAVSRLAYQQSRMMYSED